MRALTLALTVFALACAGEPTQLTATVADPVTLAAQATVPADQAQPVEVDAAAEEPTKATCPYAHLHGEDADPVEVAAATAAHGDCPHKSAEAQAAAGVTCPHMQAEAATHTTTADASAGQPPCACKHKGAASGEGVEAHAGCPHHGAEAAEAPQVTPDAQSTPGG